MSPIRSKLKDAYSKRIEYRGDSAAIRKFESIMSQRAPEEFRSALSLARRYGSLELGVFLCQQWKAMRDVSLLSSRDDFIIEDVALTIQQITAREPQLQSKALEALDAMLGDEIITDETANQVRIFRQLAGAGDEAHTTPSDRESLAAAIADAALLRGDFTLRSGRKSKYYLDKYLFSTRPELLRPVGRLIAERINEISDFRASVDRLAGAELGGIPLVTAAGLETGLPLIFVRNQKKDYGTAKQIEGKLEPKDRVIFIEDVATTGGQALEAVAALRELGARVLAVIPVIDRQEGARENIEKAKVRFEPLFTKADLGVTE